MSLDKSSKKLLAFMRSQNKGTNYVCAFDDAFSSLTDIVIEDFAEQLKRDVEDVRANVRFLEENGYLEYQYATSAKKSKYTVGFHLSHKGLNHKEFNRIDFFNFIKRSILTPIVVSILTSFVTVKLIPLAGELLKWMLSRMK